MIQIKEESGRVYLMVYLTETQNLALIQAGGSPCPGGKQTPGGRGVHFLC